MLTRIGFTLGRAAFVMGVVGALAFGAREALRGQGAPGPCNCPTVGSWDECNECCGGPDGYCTAAHRCIC